jgi:hypothetical protein
MSARMRLLRGQEEYDGGEDEKVEEEHGVVQHKEVVK